MGCAEEARAASQNVRTASALESGLLSEKKKGRLPNYIGRLGTLGAIDDKYDVAITTGN